MYESYLLQHIIAHLNQELNDREYQLFSADALSKTGIDLKNGLYISLLYDDDIVYLFKNVCPDAVSEEYFDREKRRHPVWKSEAEYKAHINNMSIGGEIKTDFFDCLKSFVEGDAREGLMPVVINQTLEEKELKNVEQVLMVAEDKIDRASFEQQRKGTGRRLSLCRFLNSYAEEHGLEKDFIILKTSMFTSNFSKDELQNVQIVFNHNGDELVKAAGDICNLLSTDSVKEDFYYLYYRETDGNRIESKEEFCEKLYYAALNMQESV